MGKKAQKHVDRAHAVLSASGASRWLNCTPSAKMSEGIPNETSPYAEEGTLAHELSENIIRYKLGLIDQKSYNEKTMELRRSKIYTTDIEDEVTPYVELVLEQVAEARAMSSDALVMVEQKVSLEAYIQEGFGTCDLIIIADGVMYVTDLKFGKGVRVSAVENSQLKLYAVGALEEFGMLYDIETIRLTISQPRLDAVSIWDVPAEDLLIWAEDFVKPQADLAFEGKGDHNPGDWCRFCKAKVFCPALKEEALFIAEADFDPNLSNEEEDELLQVFEVADRITNYLESVKAHIYKRALEGRKFPGYKLVEGRSTRRIEDESKAIAVLKRAGYDESVYLNKIVKLMGLGDLKKYLGEANRDKLLGDLIVKPEGKPSLVPESDKRPEWNSSDDFL